MKKIFLFLAVAGMAIFQSCEGPEGPQGAPGWSAESEVFELQNVDFEFSGGEYTIYRALNPVILDSDNILIYRMSGMIDANTPIWQLIPRTLFLAEGELDYDYDFSMEDFTIYAGGTYDLALSPEYLTDQTFRIVIVPGYFSKGANTVDYNDYNAVIAAFKIDDSNVKQLN